VKKQVKIENKHIENAIEVLQYAQKQLESANLPNVELMKETTKRIISALELSKMIGMDTDFYFYENEDEEGEAMQAILKSIMKRITSETEMTHFRAEISKR
jgi:hypothetical protein